MIETLLIANRGEVACRIARTCRWMGIRTTAVFTDADRGMPHVAAADEGIWVSDYLDTEEVVAAALRSGAEGLHPGVGFLAENPDLPRACDRAGITFVGPTAESMETMGSKTEARRLCERLGVPVVPGHHGSDLAAGAEVLGFPVMVKAVAGGGGRGMRRVASPEHLEAALAGARREALAAFGNGALYLEKALDAPRHLEVQLLGDRHGGLVHLGVRECSVQRRHQKIVEETPVFNLDSEVERALLSYALEIGRAVDYVGAGTVEFLLSGKTLHFLEMNTRLQVEHPVTEEVTGLDLVEWQLRVASGERLFSQEEVTFQGHAVEARIYAEDPGQDFVPCTGRILKWQPPAGVRVESGITVGTSVTGVYDPMLAKLIARGDDRAAAVRNLSRAVERTVLLGVKSNLSFLSTLLSDPAFREGEVDAGLLERGSLAQDSGPDTWALVVAAVADWLLGGRDGWRSGAGPARHPLELDGVPIEIEVCPDRSLRILLPTGEHRALGAPLRNGELYLELDGVCRRTSWGREGDCYWVHDGRHNRCFLRAPRLPEPQAAADAGGSLRAPLPGSVVEVLVEVGARVIAGQPLMRLEAMKMEHTIASAAEGTVEAVYYGVGDQVEADARLLSLREGQD